MSKIIEKVKLICSDVASNANKVWIGELYDNGDVITRWGRIRDNSGSIENQLDSKTFPGAGETFLRKKEHEKLRVKKGKESYTKALVLDNINPTNIVRPTQVDLKSIARQELAQNHPELSNLIDKLVNANIHNIISQTSITYNSSTGLFQTPLGIVIQDGINEARNLLVEIKKCLIGKCDIKNLVSRYLRIIPHDVGMKLTVESIFPNLQAVEKESDILDSLEASLKSVSNVENNPKSNVNESNKDKFFEVELDILNDSQMQRKIEDYFYKSMKSMHGYGHVKIRKIFSVRITDMDRHFNKELGNITEVYHGTSQANLLSILKSGIKTSPPSTAFIAGKMFGPGVYGAINSSKSLGYTFGRWGGNASSDSGWLFLCDFAMGKVYEPNSTCQSPPNGYNSVWAKANKVGLNHDELIVYNNNQVNIKYLLECK